MLRGSISQNAK